jgi:23S rRNA pseudouridine1911/1915/1917 synthase
VVLEDADLLIVNKPADLVCHPSKGTAWSSLIGRVRLLLGGGAEPQLINRLDRETSGIVVCAKNPAAARELRRLWEARAVAKRYLAIVHGVPDQAAGVIDAPLGRDTDSAVAIKDCVRPDGAEARTHWRLECSFRRPEGDFSLLELEPLTGRKHQLRIHLAHLSHSIVGDKIYGGDERLYLDFVTGQLTPAQRARLVLSNHALHASKLRFAWRGRDWSFHTAPEASFTEFIAGGSPLPKPPDRGT